MSEAELRRALEDAIAVAEACKAFIDEQTDRYLSGEKPDWKGAATRCFNEIDDKPDRWRAALS